MGEIKEGGKRGEEEGKIPQNIHGVSGENVGQASITKTQSSTES